MQSLSAVRFLLFLFSCLTTVFRDWVKGEFVRLLWNKEFKFTSLTMRIKPPTGIFFIPVWSKRNQMGCWERCHRQVRAKVSGKNTNFQGSKSQCCLLFFSNQPICSLWPSMWQPICDALYYFIFFVAMVNWIVSLISLSIFSLLVYRNARDFWVLILYPATLLDRKSVV